MSKVILIVKNYQMASMIALRLSKKYKKISFFVTTHTFGTTVSVRPTMMTKKMMFNINVKPLTKLARQYKKELAPFFAK